MLKDDNYKLEDDYRFVRRIKEYAQRRWKEPLICSYLWDKYDLETTLVNRKDKLCRMDVDYAYDDDFNLRIILSVNDTNPFIDAYFSCDAIAYNEDGEIEEGNFALYINQNEAVPYYRFISVLPMEFRCIFKSEFRLIAKFYPSDETDYATTININDEVNLSNIVNVQIRDYTDADYFVSSTGADTNDGSLEAPFATIQHAVDMISVGDSICCLTDLTLANSVIFYKSCELFAKEKKTTLTSSTQEYFKVFRNTQLMIHDILLDSVFDYNNGGIIENTDSALVTVESFTAKSYPNYNFELTTDNIWISGDEVSIRFKDNNRSLNGVKVYVLNSLSELVTRISTNGSAYYDIGYMVPVGLEEDTITVITPRYAYSQSFDIENITTSWYVNTVSGDDSNSGLSLRDAFKTLKHAVEQITPNQTSIYYRGEETIDSIAISEEEVWIQGSKTKGKSVLKSNSVYFSVESNSNLILQKITLGSAYMENMSVVNNGTAKIKVMVNI